MQPFVPAFLCSEIIKSFSFRVYRHFFNSSSVLASIMLVCFKFFCTEKIISFKRMHTELCNKKNKRSDNLPRWHRVLCSNVSTAKIGHCICFAIPQISNWNIQTKQAKHNREKEQAKVSSKYNSQQNIPSDDRLMQYSSAQSDLSWPDYSNKRT